ncbi:bifunctional aspartokinase/homoserine dehydrogenase, putative [Phytophthora infestans T30-4]|uniref:Bifunctional aspartokinase/homoserine dehydrogenase, putative n=1 Tax=Phytophthora infestans (strain T30-4) TaxID=403677 RepID=D0NN44_PHYIT|nr:bifunctional aspartokinase/homoserine dehydrogenase, putative [Phytophthora infestans T30-4]EEY61951.1 bifunctional aspartokinase/homoserine dehydrogenase, putative [Phytophthora infestans T30-4]|eukprot:XP_002899591.1 bifunctional aspartokinase/homoserine dehydrogenase, putative [Phytophthora infestans T30-4]
MDCTSPSMLIGANWPKEVLDNPLSLDGDSLSLSGAADAEFSHLDHRNGKRNVYKFGGTSVGSPSRLCGLVRIVREERDRVLAVVVSAMGHTTDHLLEAVAFAAKGDADSALTVVDKIQAQTLVNAHDTQKELEVADIEDMTEVILNHFKPLRELLYGICLLQEQTAAATDTVLSFGERISANIVAKLLSKSGVEAFFLDARDWLTTDDTHGCAKVLFDESKEKLQQLSEHWKPNTLPVITGFIGSTRSGRTTTLGRNGSDYTATLVGSSLGADYVLINTDISGVMTADPCIVDRAVALSHLNHHEALELAVYGTRMFHARTMVPLIKGDVTMLIRNTMDPKGHGTYISGVGRSGTRETCTTSLENLAIIEARTRILQDGSTDPHQQENIGARVTKALEELKIPVWLSIRGAHGQAISVVVPRGAEAIACAAINAELSTEIESHEVDPLNSESPVTMLSVVAEDLSKVPYNQTKFFGALADAGIEVLAVGQGTSSRSLSCVIRGVDTKVAVRRVHDAFNVDYLVTNVVLLGCNHITLGVVRQLQKQQELYRYQHKTRVNIVGFGSNCCDFLYNPKGFTFEELITRLQDCKSTTTVVSASVSVSSAYAGAPSLEQLDELQDLAIPILIDCSGQGNTQDLYSACIERGIHVVASNARSVCRLPPTSSRESVATSRAKTGRTFFMYTSTIGASLPVIDTLGNILRTGDRVLGIETSLSGSMNFVANEVMKGKKLSEAVGLVLRKGYCERDPREDFTGTDMVAKVVVLARALGVHINPNAVQLEPLIPQSVLDTITWSNDMEVDDIVSGLQAYDEVFHEKYYAPAVAENKRLHYVASIDLSKFPSIQAKIQPLLVSEDHPAFYTKDNEIAFGFSSVQYPNSLVLKGSGTGAAASATGVLRDVLTILNSLNGKNVHV